MCNIPPAFLGESVSDPLSVLTLSYLLSAKDPKNRVGSLCRLRLHILTTVKDGEFFKKDNC